MIGSAQSAYPIPDESNYSDFQPLDPYPVLENPTITSTIEANDIPVTNLSVYVSVEGNENEVPVILELVPDNGKTTEYLQLLGINLPNFQVNNGSSRIEIPTIPVGSYQLILSAPDEYFREPRGYLFQVTMDGLSFDNSLPIKFKLIPPNEQELPPCRENQTLQENSAGVGEQNDDLFTGQSICMAEQLTDLSSFPKNPEPRESVSNETLNEGWHYVGPWTTQQNKGVIGRNYVVDPGVFIGGETQFVAERVYAANGENWMEAGWAEVSWRDNKQYVYQFDSTTYEWYFFLINITFQLELLFTRKSSV